VLSKRYLTEAKCEIETPRETKRARLACAAILQSGPRKGEPCGQSAREDLRCARHTQPAVVAESDSTALSGCPVVTRKGEPCGARLRPGKSFCGRHEPKRPSPEPFLETESGPDVDMTDMTTPEPDAEPEPQPEPEPEPEPQPELEPEPEPVLVIEDPEPEPSPVPVLEELLVTGPEWQTVVLTESELHSILGTLTAPDLTLQQLEHVEREIQKCFHP
jgi:hypothetical protein